MTHFIEESTAEWADIWQRFDEVTTRVDAYDQPKEKGMFLVIQDGAYVLNVSQISDIEVYDNDWEVSMTSGKTFIVGGNDLVALKARLGL